MPTYVYQCKDCGKNFESIRPMKDSDAPIACSTCHSENTKRCLTTCAVSSDSGSSSSHSSSCGCSGCGGGSCGSCGH